MLSDQIGKIKFRHHFADPELHEDIKNKIRKLEPQYFKPLFVKSDNVYYGGITQNTLVFYGILEDGTHATVLVREIRPHFYLWLPKKNPIEVQKKIVEVLNSITSADYKSRGLTLTEYEEKNFTIAPVCTSIEKHKKFVYFREYNENPLDDALRLEFNTSRQRDHCMKFMRKLNYKTADDDYHILATISMEKGISYNKWAILNDYTRFIQNGTARYTDKFVFVIDYQNYKICEETPEHLQKDDLITLAWDIETYSPTGQLPMPEYDDHRIIMIGMNFYRHHSAEPLLRICLVDMECNPHPDFIAIKCADERELIMGFIEIIRRIKPDFYIGYNDGNYDWPWIVGRAIKYNLILDLYNAAARSNTFIKKPKDVEQFYREISIKIEAGKEVKVRNFRPPGVIPVDLLVECRRNYSSKLDNFKLNSVLSLLKLPSKKDMSPKEMNIIYKKILQEGATAENIEKYTEIALYCVHDCQSVQNIMIRGNFIFNSRPVAELSHTSLYDIFYYAGGSRVRNLTYAEGKKRKYLLSAIVEGRSKVSFPGGYVVKPRAELIKPKLSISERQKINPDWHDMPQEEIDLLYFIVEKYGAVISESRLQELKCKYAILEKPHVWEFFIEKFRPPITALDFASLYPSLMMAYNISPDMLVSPTATEQEIAKLREKYKLIEIDFINSHQDRVHGYVVWHDNIYEPEAQRYGLFPSILNGLKIKRKKLQNEKLKPLGKKIEKIEKENPDPSPELLKQLNEMKFEYMSLNSIQLAQKVFMNTYYGESGNSISALFQLHVAGGITQYGRQNLQLIIRYLHEFENCRVFYGDTDSCYFTVNPELFQDLCKSYYSGKMEKKDFMEACVHETIKRMPDIQSRVNEYLFKNNGTRALTMDYEEALYPAYFLSKKMYLGTPHIEKVNFEAPPFLRGLASAKRGASKLHKIKTNELVASILDINNLYTVRENIFRLIREIYETEWDYKRDLHLFVMTCEYSPAKNNIRVLDFVSRMREKGVTIFPSERIEYIYVDHDTLTFRGTQSKPNKSEFMEHIDIVLENKLMPDLESYFSGGIDGQFGIFIAMDPEFVVHTKTDAEYMQLSDYERNEYDKSIGQKSRDKAKKFLARYRKSLRGDTINTIKIERSQNFKVLIEYLSYIYDSVIFAIIKILLYGRMDFIDSVISKIADDAENYTKSYGYYTLKKLIKLYGDETKDFMRMRKLYTKKYLEIPIIARLNIIREKLSDCRMRLLYWADNISLDDNLPNSLLDEDLYRDLYCAIQKYKIYSVLEKKMASVRKMFIEREAE